MSHSVGRCPGVSHVLIARMSAVAAISARFHASTSITRETRARLRGVLPAPTRAPTMSHRRRYANENDTAIVLLPEAEEYFREVRDDDGFLEAAPCDFFELLGLDCDCDDKDVKAAFKRLIKTTHPDLVGAVAEPLAVLLNSAYATLSNDATRGAYRKAVEGARKTFDGGSQFDGKPVSRWLGPDGETKAVFVDESACIGCRACVAWAEGTFEMVEDQNAGRARCTRQWNDDEETMQIAVEMCPVDCIYWVKRSQLAILEYAMKGCKREDIAIMARRRSGNMGSAPSGQNPFARAERILKWRREGKRFIDAAAKQAGGVEGGTYRGHDEALAGAIASAWLALPDDVREKGWPTFARDGEPLEPLAS